MTRFRAAVLTRVGDPLAIETLELGELRATDVLVRLGASGLCHTDLEVMQGAIPLPLPIVLGHEGAGTVEAVGRDVTMVKPGDHVVCSWNPFCGRCFHCTRDQPILCEALTAANPKGRLMDGGIRYARADGGAPVHHFSVVSSHAELCVVPETGAIKVPAEIPFDRACLIGCGVMTGVGAATRVAPAPVGGHALVVGCGAVGLNAVQGARMVGCTSVIAADVAAGRRETAVRFGATETIDAAAPDALERLKALTGGRGADVVYEAAGAEPGFRFALEAVRPGGQVVFLGKVAAEKLVSFRWGSLMGEKRIVRSSYGGARPHRDFPMLARAYLDGRLKLDELITARLPLERINDGFAAMARGEGIRTVVTFN